MARASAAIAGALGPHSHELVRRLSREGLVISEYPLGVNPVGQRLLRRNEIIAALRKIGVDYVQGYAIGRPAPFERTPVRSGARAA